MSVMRQDEVFAKQVFNSFLKKVTIDPIVWKDGNQNKPPDFYLSLGNNEFIVEVTALTQQTEPGQKPGPIKTLQKSRKDFGLAIEKEALEAGILNGTYYVTFAHWHEDFQGIRKKLSQDILRFIEETQSVSQIASTPITINSLEYCSIQKTPKPDNHVYIGYPATAMFMEAAITEAKRLLKGAIVDKSKKLKKFTHPKILLLIAQFGFVDSEVYSELAKDLDLSAFHTVFLIDGYDVKQSYILHSLNNEWLNAD